MFSISTRFSPVSASSGSIHHKRYMSVHTEFGKGSTTGSKAMNRLAAVQILRRSNQRKGISKQPIFLSAPLLPFPCISACGSGCGSKLTRPLTHESNPPKSKEKVLFSRENRTFWSCWADSNRRPHPYQGCALPTELQQHNVATKKGLEPSTSSVTGWRSNQLNYLAIYAFVLKLKLAYYSKNICECQHPFLRFS